MRPASAALTVQALKHSSKPVRAAAVTAASALTESVEPLVSLQGERQKTTRIAIGQAPCIADKELVAPHREQLALALAKAKVDEVQDLMRTS